LQDDPALGPYYARTRLCWYVAKYAPVVALGAVAFAPLPTVIAIALGVALPVLIWTSTCWAGSAARVRAGLAARPAGWRALVWRLARGHLNMCGLALFICIAGVWAAVLVIPVVAVCVYGARAKGAVPLDLGRLPALSRQMLEATPGVEVFAVPDRPDCPKVVARGRAMYLSEGILSGDGADLTMVLAREVAHLRLGHRLIARLDAVWLAAVVAVAWLIAVGPGPLSLTYRLPVAGFAPAWSAMAYALFGLSLGLAAIDPILLRRLRLREQAADDLAVNLLGDGVRYAGWLRWWARENAEPLWPTRLHTVVAWTHPPTGERIARALSYGSREPTPSLMPACRAPTDWFDDHRQAALVGAWAWIFMVGWIVAKLHPGGLIR
ncbi:MAG: M48 family metalloprotease, partial [Myxococcaceae bacterium]